jgi:hypothetical protein
MPMNKTKIRAIAGLGVLAALLAGCGSGSNAATANSPPANSPPSGNAPPAAIQGVATPSSVAVVTATNAQ